MKQINTISATVSLISLIATYAVAYGFDRWSELLRRQARANFSWESYYWFLSISDLIFAVLMLALAWFVCFRANKTRIVPAIYLILGLLGVFAFAIEFSISSTTQIITPSFLLPNSRAVYVSSFAAAIGIASFISSKFHYA